MSRQLLLSGHTIRCDVGYGLAAGDGERVAVTPVAVSNAAGGILPHALGDADDLAVTILADADGDQDADVLHASAPGALVPHAVHEHVWVLVIQRPRAPFVDLGVHVLELVAQCEYLTRWGPGLLRLGAIMSFGGYCVSRPGLLRLGAVVG